MGDKLRLINRALYGLVALIVLLLFSMVLSSRGGLSPSQIDATLNRPIPSLGKLPRPNEEEAKANADHDPRQPHGSSANPVIIKVLPEEKTEAEARKEEYESQEKPSLDRGLTAYTLWLAIFTAALFTAAAVQVGLFWWQLRLIRDSLADGNVTAQAAKASADIASKALIAQSRAWLKVEVILAGQPLIYDRSGGVGTWIQLKIINIGNEPALNIRQAPDLYVKQTDCFMTDSERVAAKSEKHRLEEYGPRFSLFPKETMPSSVATARTFGTGADAAGIQGGLMHFEGQPTIYIQICGCVTYQTPSDPGRHHQTRFLCNLRPTDAWHFVVGQDVPADQLRLEDDTASLGNHAD